MHIPVYVGFEYVDYWFQDEARIGQQNTTTRIWAAKGSRTQVVKQQQFEYAHIYGAVCPSTGQTEAFISPSLGRVGMRQHLQQISAATAIGRHAVVIMDRASWHMSDVADEFDNVTILPLPPYSPELNPMEQVWQWLRQRELANRCFSGYQDIVEQLSRAWNIFRSDIERVKTMTNRDWLNLIT